MKLSELAGQNRTLIGAVLLSIGHSGKNDDPIAFVQKRGADGPTDVYAVSQVGLAICREETVPGDAPYPKVAGTLIRWDRIGYTVSSDAVKGSLNDPPISTVKLTMAVPGEDALEISAVSARAKGDDNGASDFVAACLPMLHAQQRVWTGTDPG